MTKYGYARVSSSGQKLETQLELLEEAGCEFIYREKRSGKNKKDRKEFNKLLNVVEEGDSITITKLDRAFRSTKDALDTIEFLRSKQVNLIVLNMGGDKLDISTPIGILMVTILSGIATFELDLLKERQTDGIISAKANNVVFGRPKKYGDSSKSMQYAIELYRQRHQNGMTVKDICDITKVSRSALYREAHKEEERFV